MSNVLQPGVSDTYSSSQIIGASNLQIRNTRDAYRFHVCMGSGLELRFTKHNLVIKANSSLEFLSVEETRTRTVVRESCHHTTTLFSVCWKSTGERLFWTEFAIWTESILVYWASHVIHPQGHAPHPHNHYGMFRESTCLAKGSIFSENQRYQKINVFSNLDNKRCHTNCSQFYRGFTVDLQNSQLNLSLL